MSNRKIKKKWLRWERYEDRLIALSPHTSCSAGLLQAWGRYVRMQNAKADRRGEQDVPLEDLLSRATSGGVVRG